MSQSQNEQPGFSLEFKDKNGKKIDVGCHIRLSELGRQKLLDFNEKEVGLPRTEDDQEFVVSYRGFVKDIDSGGTISVIYEDNDDTPEHLRINKFLPEDLIVQ